MQLSANTQVKTIEGHCKFSGRSNPCPLPAHTGVLTSADCLVDTGHFKAVVTNPKNVMVTRSHTATLIISLALTLVLALTPTRALDQILRDIACAGYVAGCNTQFFTKANNVHTLGQGLKAIEERLAMDDTVAGKYGSMLAFPCSAQQFEANQGLDTVMSVTSRLLPWEITGVNARNHSSFPGGQAVYEEYRGKLGLDQVHYGEDVKVRHTHTHTRTHARTHARTHSRAFSLSAGRGEPGVCEPGIHQQRNVLHGPLPLL